MIQEFALSVTPLSSDQYLIRTERVAKGIPLAEEQITLPIEQWLTLLSQPHDAVELGQSLYQALFQGQIWESWFAAQTLAQQQAQPLRLRLGLRSEPLARLPWELLYSESGWLATRPDLFLSRYPVEPGLLLPQSQLPQVYGIPLESLRVLVVTTIAIDDTEATRQKLQPLLELWEESGAEVKLLEQPDRRTFLQALEQELYDVFYYLGSSELQLEPEALGFLSQRTGMIETLMADDLSAALVKGQVALVILQYLPQTTATPEHNFRLSQFLIQRGLPAVLLLPAVIPLETAVKLLQSFFQSLNQGHSIDEGLAQSRREIRTTRSGQVHWFYPLLHLHPEYQGEEFLSEMESKTTTDERIPQYFLFGQDQGFPDWSDDLAEEEIEDYDDEDAAVVASLMGQLPLTELSPPPAPAPTVFKAGSETGAPIPTSPPTTPNLPIPQQSWTERLQLFLGSQIVWMASLLIAALSGLWLLSSHFKILSTAHLSTGTSPLPAEQKPASKVDPKSLAHLSTTNLQALAIKQFRQGDRSSGQQAITTLLDRGALAQAETAFSTVPTALAAEPDLQFLQGRLAWQALQSGYSTYQLGDVQKRWEAAAQADPNTPLYQNALGFLYYALGDLSRADQSWFRSLYLCEEKLSKSNKTSNSPPPDKMTDPEKLQVNDADSLTAYAGLALVLFRSAQNRDATEAGALLKRATKLYTLVTQQDRVNFQPEALNRNWLWTEQAISDWQALAKL